VAWQYASGGWALLVSPGRQDTLRIADNLHFGPAVAPAVEAPYQITGVPRSWHFSYVVTRWHGVQYPFEATIETGPTPVSESVNTGISFEVTAAAPQRDCDNLLKHDQDFRTSYIHGYRVDTAYLGSFLGYALCAADADGLYIWMRLPGHPAISPAELFAHHLRLLGWPSTADWTTKPIN
jgi:hypothetical protein